MRVALVAPRYGEAIVGGAETLIRDYATRLAGRGHDVEVLTTCARDHFTWANELPAGSTKVDGVTLHRFPVSRARDNVIMGHLQRCLDAGLRLDRSAEVAWVANTGESAPLLEAIARVADRADAILFAPYLFASTVQGGRVRPDRSLVVPCLHDEAYARFSVIQDTMRHVAGLLFNSRAERDLARRLLAAMPPHQVVGAGFDDIRPSDANDFRHRHHLGGDLVSYAGRREPGKNFPLLVEYITLYAKALGRASPVTLVTMGSGRVTLPHASRGLVADLGYVTAAEKAEAIAASVATAVLSVNESFSFLMCEGWLEGVPAIVNADCPVTRQHCEESGGGVWVRSPEEFAEALDRLRADGDLRRRMGLAGRDWLLRHYSWDAVLDRLEDAVQRLVT